MTIDCIQCGKPFVRKSRKASQKLCSNACKFAYQRIHPSNYKGAERSKECEVCQAEFTYRPKTRPNAKFCSYKCRNIWQHRTWGEINRSTKYENSRSFRTMIRRRFLSKCAICGWDEAPCDVAHIVAKKDGGLDHIDNIVILCPNHHRMYDRGLISTATVRLARRNCIPKK